MKHSRNWILVLGGLAGLLLGCAENGGLEGTQVPNTPPDTQITATPPAVDRTTSRVTFFWTGRDPDGDVVGFEWRISDNGPDGMVDTQDTLEVGLPWHFTTAHDSTFEVSADLDSFVVDLDDPDLDPSDIRFWQTHTFYVRAVDNEGRRDPTPAEQSFTATTLAPTVVVDIPVLRQGQTCAQAARVLTFGWKVFDADANGAEPAFIRTILLPAQNANGGCFSRSQFEAEQPLRADDPLWGDWVRWGEPGSTTITYPRQAADTKLIFAVQAMDRAGAVTPSFTWQRNVRHVEIGSTLQPTLTVREPILGERHFAGTHGFISYEVIGGQELNFSWEGDASLYAGVIEAYQHGWNLVDPDDPNDPGWAGTWGNGPAFTSVTRSFPAGEANLVIVCRDNQGQIARATIQLSVIEIPDRSEQRPLLIVDDFPDGTGSVGHEEFDIFTDKQWVQAFDGYVQGFGATDVIDAEHDEPRVTMRTLVGYQSVIWFISASSTTFFQRNLAPQSRPVINWLEIYQQRAGNVMVCGPGATFDMIERGGFSTWTFPIPFNTSHSPGLGFGTARDSQGRPYNVGTRRWPYSGFCIESLDLVRPAIGFIYGEDNSVLRTRDCDGLHRALVADEFLATYPDAYGRVRDLDPTAHRSSLDPQYQPTSEEVYNINATRRPLILTPRDCQTPMFTHRARRDEGASASNPATCPPEGSTMSTLDGAAIAVVSRVYSDSKPLRGSDDFLWGFHLWGFKTGDVTDALQWIAERNWNVRQ